MKECTVRFLACSLAVAFAIGGVASLTGCGSKPEASGKPATVDQLQQSRSVVNRKKAEGN